MDGNGVPIPAGSSNQGPVIYGIDWAFFCLSTIFVATRLGTRIWITRNFGWDDTTIALSQARPILKRVETARLLTICRA